MKYSIQPIGDYYEFCNTKETQEEEKEQIVDIVNHPYMAIDWLFVVVAFLVYKATEKKLPYRHASAILCTQFFVVTGFSTIWIWAGLENSLEFYSVKMFVYIIASAFISITGDRILSNVCKWIGGFHAWLIVNDWLGAINVDLIKEEYSVIMISFMSLQLILAFRGWLYGKYIRIVNRTNDVRCRRPDYVGSHK